MASILICGCLAIAGTVWQRQRAVDEPAAIAGTTAAPQPSHLVRTAPTASDLTRQLKVLEDRVRDLEATKQARAITSKTADDIAAYLRQFGGGRVLVSCIPDDIEAYQYANQIVNILRAADWDAQGPEVTKIFGDVRAPGINVYVNGDNYSDTVKILLDTFAKFNIPYQSRVTPSGAIPETKTVELFVGKQQSAKVSAGAD
jgi:hypothetical protein